MVPVAILWKMVFLKDNKFCLWAAVSVSYLTRFLSLLVIYPLGSCFHAQVNPQLVSKTSQNRVATTSDGNVYFKHISLFVHVLWCNSFGKIKFTCVYLNPHKWFFNRKRFFVKLMSVRL